MYIHDTLDRIAELAIPEGRHELLYVDCRKAWVESIEYMIQVGLIKPTSKNIYRLAENWEKVLYAKYSVLN